MEIAVIIYYYCYLFAVSPLDKIKADLYNLSVKHEQNTTS